MNQLKNLGQQLKEDLFKDPEFKKMLGNFFVLNYKEEDPEISNQQSKKSSNTFNPLNKDNIGRQMNDINLGSLLNDILLMKKNSEKNNEENNNHKTNQTEKTSKNNTVGLQNIQLNELGYVLSESLNQDGLVLTIPLYGESLINLDLNNEGLRVLVETKSISYNEDSLSEDEISFLSKIISHKTSHMNNIFIPIQNLEKVDFSKSKVVKTNRCFIMYIPYIKKEEYSFKRTF